MNFLFSPLSLDDLIRLLKAWRFWVLGVLAGAILGTALFYVAPPPYRARATVNVDFNLEEAWPEEIDRQQFYYLERETRKLEEIAWSDAVMQAVADASGVDVSTLRENVLSLSQPAEAGWHFYADDRDPALAEALASSWALAFTEQARVKISSDSGVSSYTRLNVTQVEDLPVYRSISQSTYLLSSVVGFLALSIMLALFIKPKQSKE